jgi:hypothetical protein
MRRAQSLAAVLLLFCTASFAKSPKKSNLNRMITQARYVIVTTYYGNSIVNTNTPPEDRNAMVAMEQALMKWGRYHVVYSPEMADLVVLVRKGRYGSVTGGGTIGVGNGGGIRVGSPFPTNIPGTVPDNRPTGGTGPYGGVEAGMPDDELALYDARLGLDGTPLWHRMQPQGLRTPKLPLLEELKKEVAEADKEDRAKKNP